MPEIAMICFCFAVICCSQNPESRNLNCLVLIPPCPARACARSRAASPTGAPKPARQAVAMAASARERVRPRVRAVGEAGEPEGGRVDQSRIAGDHVGHQLASPRTDAEPMAGKPGRDEK